MFLRHVTKDISAYCHGELSSEESKQFAEHIIACAKCRTKYEEVKLGIKLAEQLPVVAAPDHLWRDVEPLLAKQSTNTESRPLTWSWPVFAAVAAVLVAVVSIAGFWIYNNSRRSQIASSTGKGSWQVKRLDGTPRIGAEQIANNGQLGVGEWLETDGR